MHYDWLVVGAGLFGAVFAQQAKQRGETVLVLDKRPHIAGNVYTDNEDGIHVHRYGAHIFHTNNEAVWQYANRFADFNRFTNSPLAAYRGQLFSLPFSMYTFHELWGVRTPAEAQAILDRQRKEAWTEQPANLEQQALNLVGRDVYEKLIKGYTEKQWGRPCTELPAFIIRRLPLRMVYDNNYFNARFQGIPQQGYTAWVAAMLDCIPVQLNTDYLADRERWNAMADRVVYTGPLDAYFNHCYGHLAYRSIRFETERLDMPNAQGNAVINETDAAVPYTRTIEHKWFRFGLDDDGKEIPHTIISREYSSEWHPGDEPYYPVNDEANNALAERYKALAAQEKTTVFGGRLGEYRYYDMDAVIASALDACTTL